MVIYDTLNSKYEMLKLDYQHLTILPKVEKIQFHE